jgi:hypothetical protein
MGVISEVFSALSLAPTGGSVVDALLIDLKHWLKPLLIDYDGKF